MPDLTGTTLGKYRLLERLGRGGMAEVYRAFQPNLERDVAVKVMHAYLAEDPGFVGRFKREAKAVASLRHPHIVQVYDFEVEGDVYYMVMEYIAGETLKARLERLHAEGRQMTLEEADAIFRPLCEALDYAHSQGRVHRDIKPANIMFDGNRLVLTDFGVATIVGGTSYTAPGTMVGTPAYMSPEQCRGEPGDVRSDIYSLGIVLYEMLAGQVPFDADTPLAIVLKHLNDPLPLPSRVVQGLPPAVEHVILKALSKAPEDRYPSALALADAFSAAVRDQKQAALEEAVVGRERPAPPPAAPESRSMPPGPPSIAPEARPALPEPLPAAAESRPAGGKQTLAPGGRWPIWAWGSVVVLVLVAIPAILLAAGPRLFGLGGAASVPTAGEVAYREPTELLAAPTAVAALMPTGEATGVAARPPTEEATGGAVSAPDPVAAYEAGLVALTEDGDTFQAIADFTAALSGDPEMVEAYYWRGIAYRENGQFAEALADLTQAIALAPEWAEAYCERSTVYLYMDPAQLEAAYADASQAIELSPDDTACYTIRAHISYISGNITSTLADLDQALELNPDDTEAWRMRGEIDFYQEDYGQAVEDLGQAVALDPSDTYSQWLLGIVYYERGQYEEAIARYDEALEYAPEASEYYYGRGIARIALGDDEEALADLDQALVLDPEQSGARYGRGRLYAQAGRYEEAVAEFTAVLADVNEVWVWPFFSEDSPYLDRALAYQELGQTGEALADLDALIEIRMDWYLPYYHRGLLYKAQGQNDAALADFQQAYDLAPDDEWRQRIQEEIDALTP